MSCPGCGAAVEEGAEICFECGEPIPAGAPESLAGLVPDSDSVAESIQSDRAAPDSLAGLVPDSDVVSDRDPARGSAPRSAALRARAAQKFRRADEEEKIRCRGCGTPNATDAPRCRGCGAPLPARE